MRESEVKHMPCDYMIDNAFYHKKMYVYMCVCVCDLRCV
jgi:hypothetical protein